MGGNAQILFDFMKSASDFMSLAFTPVSFCVPKSEQPQADLLVLKMDTGWHMFDATKVAHID